MSVLPLLFFLFILFIPCVVADDNESSILAFLNDINNNTWDGSFDSLNYDATKPSVVWVSSPHMAAWVDIVGYRNLSRIHNVDYIYGDPVACVLVESEVKDLLGWNDNVDWIDKQYSYNVSNGNIAAIISITMRWHHSTEILHPNGNKGVDKDYYYSYLTITDTERLPLQYNYTSAHTPVSVLFYNNTFSPKSIITVPGSSGLYYITYLYKNEYLKQYLMNAEVEDNPKGIEYINFTDKHTWDESAGNLSHLGSRCVISGANFTLDNLSVSLHTPYRALNTSGYNLTVDNVSVGTCFKLSLIPVMFVIGLSLSTLYLIIRKTWR